MRPLTCPSYSTLELGFLGELAGGEWGVPCGSTLDLLFEIPDSDKFTELGRHRCQGLKVNDVLSLGRKVQPGTSSALLNTCRGRRETL